MTTTSTTPRIAAPLPTLPRAAERDGTAGRILSAGLMLFAQRGFDGTSIRDLGHALSLEPGNLYAHFRSKQHLLAELVRVGHEEHLERLQRALVGSAAGPVAQVRALVHAHVKFHAEHAMLAAVANHEMHALSAELAAPALALRQKSEALFVDVVERGVARRVFSVPHPWVTVAAIGGMGMRVAHWYRPGFELSPDGVADVHAELAVRMLAA
jgi:AcrR family transcriptional regulator